MNGNSLPPSNPSHRGLQPQKGPLAHFRCDLCSNTTRHARLMNNHEPLRPAHTLNNSLHIPWQYCPEINQFNLGTAQGGWDKWCERRWWGIEKLDCRFTMVDWSAPCEECEVGPGNENLCAGEGECVVVDGNLFNCGQGYGSIAQGSLQEREIPAERYRILGSMKRTGLGSRMAERRSPLHWIGERGMTI